MVVPETICTPFMKHFGAEHDDDGTETCALDKLITSQYLSK